MSRKTATAHLEDHSDKDIRDAIDAEFLRIKSHVFTSTPPEINETLNGIEKQAKKIGYHAGVAETYQMYGWVHWSLHSTSDEVIRLYEKAQDYALKHGYLKGYASSKFFATKAKFVLSKDRDFWLAN